MTFEFIDNSVAIDRAARRRIRTHAATGKNANKTLARSSKAVALKKDNSATLFRTPARIRNAHRSTSDGPGDAEVVEIERPVSDGVLFPIPVPARSKGLVREALFFFSGARYNPELDGALEMPDHMGSVWVRNFFLDEAYFHSSVATTILCSKNLASETTQGMYHIACTYRIIQERLMSATDATSDMTIAILVVMSQYERLQGQYERGYVHIQGLRRMIELRGGVKRFGSECCGVILKVLRADLEYALQLGSRTLFGLHGIEYLRTLRSSHSDETRPNGQFNNLETDRFLQNLLREDLWTTYERMRSVAVMLNEAGAGQRQKLGADEFHHTILLLGYSLLHISPLRSSSESDSDPAPNMSILEQAIHLGLIAFLVSFLRGLDQRISDKPLLSHRLRLAIKDLSLRGEKGQGSNAVKCVLLWTLFIGSVAVFKPSDDEWLIPTTRTAMQALDLSTWEDVRQVVAAFPWVNALHDRTGIVLCSAQKFLEIPYQSN
ncbi:uncharacterized protein APUU_51163S [Aspergillus puulaauensis]|uniref:Tachykinin family protein n=1 Tax=Aspergillus puulaauensis TaxID=1220207 RepID=A0A7R7XRJ4_9EURO|nr:uncharacterized protein APUU_51163S [Aspergillus puulaauensis]BCS26452.1 hypothetical protein APUU_51163S [Aspergillus puulaauensis]